MAMFLYTKRLMLSTSLSKSAPPTSFRNASTITGHNLNSSLTLSSVTALQININLLDKLPISSSDMSKVLEKVLENSLSLVSIDIVKYLNSGVHTQLDD